MSIDDPSSANPSAFCRSELRKLSRHPSAPAHQVLAALPRNLSDAVPRLLPRPVRPGTGVLRRGLLAMPRARRPPVGPTGPGEANRTKRDSRGLSCEWPPRVR